MSKRQMNPRSYDVCDCSDSNHAPQTVINPPQPQAAGPSAEPQPKKPNKPMIPVYQFSASSGYESEPLILRVEKTADEKHVFVDIRRFRKAVPTRQGVCLFPWEIKWVHQMVTDRTEGSLNHAREVQLLRIWDGIRIMVKKGSFKRGEMDIVGPEFLGFNRHLPAILECVDHLSAGLGLANDFGEGDKYVSLADNMFSA